MKDKKMKEKKMYINRYYFYAVNVWVLLWAGVAILSYGFFQLWMLSVSQQTAKSVSIIGGADGPTAIFLTSQIGSVIELFIIIGMLLVWGATYSNYQKGKDEIKQVSMKTSMFCAVLAMIILGISGESMLALIPLSLGIILMVLWNSKKFEAKK